MKLSTDRILTTHVGSLPRPADVAELLLKKEQEEPFDEAELDARVRRGVAEIVARQVDAGVDVVSDGEMSKVAYSTYAKDRLTGFAGDSERRFNLDVAPYPAFREKMARMTGNQPMRRPQCVGPIEVRTSEPLRKDLANFKAALEGAGVTEAFHDVVLSGRGVGVHA